MKLAEFTLKVLLSIQTVYKLICSKLKFDKNKQAAVQVLQAGEKVPIPRSSALILREIPEKTPLKVSLV